jgi:tellurite resistance-related uncharacterized protein
MTEPTIPENLVEARRTPLFDLESLSDALTRSHRTAMWATIHVQDGSVRYIDLEGDAPRDVRVEAGESTVIKPRVKHRIEPATDAKFYVQLYREPDAGMVPGSAARTASTR